MKDEINLKGAFPAEADWTTTAEWSTTEMMTTTTTDEMQVEDTYDC